MRQNFGFPDWTLVVLHARAVPLKKSPILLYKYMEPKYQAQAALALVDKIASNKPNSGPSAHASPNIEHKVVFLLM